MNSKNPRFTLEGPAGQLECAMDLPQGTPEGIVLLAHPHPLYGGAMDNKVVEILARTFVELNHVATRMNFRGVGASQGAHAHGEGEADDMMLLLEHVCRLYPGLPVSLAGYSFGTYVSALVQQKMAKAGSPPRRMVLVSVTAGRWSVDQVPSNTVLIHGEDDDLVPLQDVFQWARPQDLPVTVVTGADHLFNRKLHHISRLVTDLWHR